MKSLVTRKKATSHPFLPRELLTCQSHLCAGEDHGADHPGNYTKAHKREEGDLKQPARLHQAQNLTKLVAFYFGVAAPMNKERATDLVYLDLREVFDSVLQNFLLSKLGRYGFDGWTVDQTRKIIP